MDDIAQESISILSDIEQKVSLFTGRKEVSVFSLRNFLYHRMDLCIVPPPQLTNAATEEGKMNREKLTTNSFSDNQTVFFQ